MSNYAQISATSLVKNQPGKLKGIFVSTVTSTPTITIYDAQTADTSVKIIDTFTMSAATNLIFFDGINCENGLYVVISGTASLTVYFE
jgi:hypothetical protein